MSEINVQEVIVSRLLTRGDGKKDPIRKVLQVYTKSGELLTEDDPLWRFCDADMLDFAKYCTKRPNDYINNNSLLEWQQNRNQ